MSTAKKGRIIILNGASSSGKTSLAKELQKLLEASYLHIGLDAFIDMFPENYGYIEDKYLQEINRKSILSAMNTCIVSLANSGYNLIVDHVLDERDSEKEIITQLSPFHVMFIGIHFPLEILEKREKSRGDRQIGLAKSQYDIVHSNKSYDLEVDTNVNNSTECALKIIASM